MKTTIKYVLQGRYKGAESLWNPWQDEAKDDNILQIDREYRSAVNLSKVYNKEFRIVKRTIIEFDEVLCNS